MKATGLNQKNESLKKKGIHVVMNNYLYGTRQIISKKPIRTVDDLAGLKNSRS